jgi:hypothetical protein
MKKILLILFEFFITTSVFAEDGHGTCTKKDSILLNVKKKAYKNSEIITLDSFSSVDSYGVIKGDYKSNPAKFTGLLSLPSGTNKVPIIIWQHGSGGAADFASNYYQKLHSGLHEMGIGVMFLDSYCARGVKDTWRDPWKGPLMNQAIDSFMALKYLKSHPRFNGKIGAAGHSRGGANGIMVSDVKFASIFTGNNKGFDAVLAEAPECRMSGFFVNYELTSNTKLKYVGGSLDNWTPAAPCVEYLKKAKSNKKIEIDVKEGWHHYWIGDFRVRKVGAPNFEGCPYYMVDDNGVGVGEIVEIGLNKHKLFPSMEAFHISAKENPKKHFKIMMSLLKKEKCFKRGVTLGGNHGFEFAPEVLSFFKTNLL